VASRCRGISGILERKGSQILVAVLALVLVAIWPDAANAEFDLTNLKPYDKITVTKIDLTGDNVTKDYVISRELETRVGEPLSIAVLGRDLSRLDNLGIFSSIQVNPSDYEGGVALEFVFRELPWILPYLKFKYTEANGWSVGPTVTSVNMLGRDIYLSGYVLVGGTTTFSVRLTWPWIKGNHVSLFMIAEHLEYTNIFYDFEETDDEFTPWIGRYIWEHGRMRGTVAYFGVSSDVDGRTLDPDNQDHFMRIGAAVGYDRRDSWQNPHEGWWEEIEAFTTGGWLPGDGDFNTITLDLRRYQPAFNERQTLTMGGLLTYQSGTVGTDIPVYMQYNLGGANTIRGHTVDGLAQTLFGKNQLIFTAEYDFLLMPIEEYIAIKWPVTLGIEATLFVDSGIAWSDNADFNTERWHSGFGFGLRALVPGIEVARFDIGFNLQGGTEFHFGLRSKFDAQRLRLR